MLMFVKRFCTFFLITFSVISSLAELLLSPTRRVKDYTNLLAWFEHNTPPDHADREDLKRARNVMADLQQLIIDVSSGVLEFQNGGGGDCRNLCTTQTVVSAPKYLRTEEKNNDNSSIIFEYQFMHTRFYCHSMCPLAVIDK